MTRVVSCVLFPNVSLGGINEEDGTAVLTRRSINRHSWELPGNWQALEKAGCGFQSTVEYGTNSSPWTRELQKCIANPKLGIR